MPGKGIAMKLHCPALPRVVPGPWLVWAGVAIGFGLGYALARMLGLGVGEARTISIEVGMQNSGLGSGLAKTPAFRAQFASAAQAALAPVPAAISAVWHVLIGSILASYWRHKN